MDRIGIHEELAERRESIASRLSPTARHQAFPTVYARPVPREATVIVDPTPPLRAEIALLNEEVARLKRENGRLTVLVAELSRPISQRVEPPMREVTIAFCDAMNAAGRNVDDKPWSNEWLQTKRRIHPISHPRQVCIWLVREICPSPSTPMIASIFGGGMDHTSVLHACRRAASLMDVDPGLRQVAVSVLRKFGVNPALLEKGEAL